MSGATNLVRTPAIWNGNVHGTALAETVLIEDLLGPFEMDDVPELPSFLSTLHAVERHSGQRFDHLPAASQQAVVERRLHQLVEVCRTNALWRARIDGAIGGGPLDSLTAFEAIPPTDKETARLFYTGDRPGMVVPIARGGFQVATSGGTASGQPTEIVYPKDELQDTYAWAGAFIGRHIVDRHMPGSDARWVACTLADHMMWSSSSMVGGVLQNIPGINYIGAGAIDREVFRRILAYPGSKAIMGISRSVADLVAFAEHASATERASLRIALYGSGALQPKVHADLRAAYPNLAVLSFFAAMQAETIGLQLDPQSPVLTAIPGLHHIEIVDDENHAVGVGEEGDLLVTRLFGNGAPVLRYRLGDRMVRYPDLASDGLNAPRFEYVGRSSDLFALGEVHFYAPTAVASITQLLRARELVDLERIAEDVQITLDHAARRITIMASTVQGGELDRRLDADIVERAIIAALAQTQVGKTETTEAALHNSGFRFALALVSPNSPHLVTTSVGKTPLLVELR